MNIDHVKNELKNIKRDESRWYYVGPFDEDTIEQKMLDSYQTQQVAYEEKIQEEKDKNVELLSIQENVNSTEYIEEIAREKLDMYLPNERRYIDVSK